MQHIPVLLKESLEYLNAAKGGIFIDGTAGDGGHTIGILRANPANRVLAIDWDSQAVGRLEERLKSENLSARCEVVKGNYADVLQNPPQEFSKVDGIILDLGFSSRQIDDASRGFSFQQTGPLDMRYDAARQKTAAEIINTYSETKLSEIIKEYGEEKFNRAIAAKIVAERIDAPFTDTVQVFHVIKEALPKPVQHKAADSARRVFQALRIEVNAELDNVRRALPQSLRLLKSGGRLAVISFHSLEDRIVKQFFREEAKQCVCPPEFPMCVCGKSSNIKVLTRKPIAASEEEVNSNPRSKPAKLRAAEKI